MSEHAGELNQPTLVRSAFTFAPSASDCSSVMFIFALSTLSMALRPSSPTLATAWCAHVGSSTTSPSPPVPSPPRARRAAFRAGAARSFMVLLARSPAILARSLARSALRRCAWKAAASAASPSATSPSAAAPFAGSPPAAAASSCTSRSSPSASASSQASAIEASTALNFCCCPADVLSEISSMPSARDSSLPDSLLRRKSSCARISFCCELAASAT